MVAIGYGDTLGAAILSEGLAGHFVLEIFSGDPELWEMIDCERYMLILVICSQNGTQRTTTTMIGFMEQVNYFDGWVTH